MLVVYASAEYTPQSPITVETYSQTPFPCPRNLGDEKEVVEAIRACSQAIPVQLGRLPCLHWPAACRSVQNF